MFISLNSGQYLFKCQCGGRYQIIALKRPVKKICNICFYCGSIGFYTKITMDNLNFGYNWNGKLNCNCFTTIRLHNEKRFYPGARFEITLENRPKGSAKVLQIKPFLFDKLNEFTARIDTGYPLEDCKKMLKQMYKNEPLLNWQTQLFDLVLLEYDKPQTTLFNK